jgi:hypothetical protein
MAIFDPSKGRNGGTEGSAAELLPAGEYLVAIVWLQLRTARSGASFARVKVQVCNGPMAGKCFFTALSLDLSKNGSRARLEMLCRSAGITEPFDVDSEKQVARAVKNRPFKARIEQRDEVDRRDGTTRRVNEIARYVVKLTPDEQRAAANWVLDREEAALSGVTTRDDDDKYDDDDEYAVSASQDDDIPF